MNEIQKNGNNSEMAKRVNVRAEYNSLEELPKEVTDFISIAENAERSVSLAASKKGIQAGHTDIKRYGLGILSTTVRTGNGKVQIENRHTAAQLRIDPDFISGTSVLVQAHIVNQEGQYKAGQTNAHRDQGDGTYVSVRLVVPHGSTDENVRVTVSRAGDASESDGESAYSASGSALSQKDLESITKVSNQLEDLVGTYVNDFQSEPTRIFTREFVTERAEILDPHFKS